MTHEEFIEGLEALGFTPDHGELEMKWIHLPSGVSVSEDGIRDLAANLGPAVYDETLQSPLRRTDPK